MRRSGGGYWRESPVASMRPGSKHITWMPGCSRASPVAVAALRSFEVV